MNMIQKIHLARSEQLLCPPSVNLFDLDLSGRVVNQNPLNQTREGRTSRLAVLKVDEYMWFIPFSSKTCE